MNGGGGAGGCAEGDRRVAAAPMLRTAPQPDRTQLERSWLAPDLALAAAVLAADGALPAAALVDRVLMASWASTARCARCAGCCRRCSPREPSSSRRCTPASCRSCTCGLSRPSKVDRAQIVGKEGAENLRLGHLERLQQLLERPASDEELHLLLRLPQPREVLRAIVLARRRRRVPRHRSQLKRRLRWRHTPSPPPRVAGSRSHTLHAARATRDDLSVVAGVAHPAGAGGGVPAFGGDDVQARRSARKLAGRCSARWSRALLRAARGSIPSRRNRLASVSGWAARPGRRPGNSHCSALARPVRSLWSRALGGLAGGWRVARRSRWRRFRGAGARPRCWARWRCRGLLDGVG